MQQSKRQCNKTRIKISELYQSPQTRLASNRQDISLEANLFLVYYCFFLTSVAALSAIFQTKRL